ncbi:MAG: phage portal protein, partial [Arenimonas sp.]
MPGKITRMEAAAMALASSGWKAAAAAFTFPSMMTHSGSKGWVSLAPRNFPWAQTDLMGNSAFNQCLAWITRNFPQGVFQVIREQRDGTKKPVENHPLTDLVYMPNGGYGADALWAGTLASYFLDGNAYWIKVRNVRGLGVPSALWYCPHWMIEPAWSSDGGEFISHYEYRVNGKTVKLKIDDVVHFRFGLDPNNTRKGRSPMRAVLREAFTDDEASYFAAALLKNMAIPGVVLAPSESIGMNATKAEQIKELWKRKFGGDNRGEPLILDFQASIDTIGFSPNDLNFEVLRRIPEERISGAFGIPAIVAGLGVGLDASTYNNLANLKKSAFEECLMPAWECFADTLATQLLPDFTTRPDEWCRFDVANVRALQENEDARHKRIREDFHQGLISFNESRSALGLPPLPAGDYWLIPNNARPATAEAIMARASTLADPPPASSPDNLPAPGAEPKQLTDGKKKAFEFDGIQCSREPTDLEKLIGLKSIADAMATSQQTIGAELSTIRARLIAAAAAELAQMEPDQWHTLTLAATDGERQALKAAVTVVF